MTHTLKILLSIALGLTLLAGCANSGSQKESTDKAQTEETAKAQTMIYDQKLGFRLDITSTKTSMRGDLHQVQIVLKNDWHSELTFKYKVVWQDKNGIEFDPEASPWHPLTLPSQASKTFQSTAPNPSATNFIVHIKE